MTRGFMTAATFSRWSGQRSWRGCPSTPRLAPVRRASMTSSSGSRPQGGSVHIDPSRPATMYRGTMLRDARELEAVRQMENVVRLGRVRRSRPTGVVLECGEIETGPDVLHVDCTALGLNNAPATAIFQPGGSCSSRYNPLTHFQRCGSSASSRPAATTTRTPALPTQPLPEHHRGLASHNQPHVAHRGAMVERA